MYLCNSSNNLDWVNAMIYDLYDLSSQIGTRTINTNKNTQHIGLRLQTKMYTSRPLTDHGLETQISGHI